MIRLDAVPTSGWRHICGAINEHPLSSTTSFVARCSNPRTPLNASAIFRAPGPASVAVAFSICNDTIISLFAKANLTHTGNSNNFLRSVVEGLDHAIRIRGTFEKPVCAENTAVKALDTPYVEF